MATLATQSIVRAGLNPALTAAAGGGDKFTPDSNTFLRVDNGSGGALTVTIVTPRNNAIGLAVDDVAVSVPAGGSRLIGPFPAEYFANPADGLASVTYSGVTSLTVGALKVTQP
jgi:hypothetical protein